MIKHGTINEDKLTCPSNIEASTVIAFTRFDCFQCKVRQLNANKTFLLFQTPY